MATQGQTTTGLRARSHTFWRLLGYLRRYRGYTVLTLLSLVASAGLDIVRPLLIMEVVDQVIVGGRVDRLAVFVGAILGVAVLHGGVTFAFTYLRRLTGQRVVYDLRNELYGHLHYLDSRFYDRSRTGELMSRTATDVNSVRRFMSFGLFTFLRIIVSFAFVVWSSWMLNPPLTGVMLVTGPGLYLTVRSFRRQIKPAFRAILEQNADLSAVLQENVAGIRVVRSFGQEEQEQRKFDVENWESFEREMAAARIRALHAPLMDFWGLISRAVLLLVGGWFVMEGRITIGTFVALDGYLARMLQPIRESHHLLDMVGEAISSGERIFALLDTPPGLVDRAGFAPVSPGWETPSPETPSPVATADVSARSAPPAGQLVRSRGRVEFQGVWLSYDFAHAGRDESLAGKAPRWALRDVSLAVEPGETIAIVGETGSGKSSLVRLINRTYDPDRGRVLLDGRDIRDYPLQWLRRQVALIAQESFLFSASVWENIAYGRPDASREEVEEAARRALAHEFIVRLPKGYDTIVGERGAGLSGGQKQRITIARALVMRPAVLIIDDATSALDMETEYLIWENLSDVLKTCTTFIVAQRLTTLRHVDRIAVMKQGQIVEIGTHEQLLAAGGVYAHLYRLQVDEGDDSVLGVRKGSVAGGAD